MALSSILDSVVQGRPFAVVDEVAAGSPAASAGVQLGDQWISFGRSGGTRGSSIASVAATLQVLFVPSLCMCQ